MNKKYLLLLLVLPFFPSCDNGDSESDNKPKTVDPMMLISAATYVTPVDAVLNGEIRVLGTKPVTDHGFIYSENPITTVNDGTKISLGAGTIITKITARATNLAKQKKYYAKAFATNEDTSVLSEEISFTTGKANEWVSLITYPSNGFLGVRFTSTGFFIKGKVYLASETLLVEDKAIIPIYEYDPLAPFENVIKTFPARYKTYYISFAIADTLYVGLGQHDIQKEKEIWKYNVASKTWKQGKDFPITPNKALAYTINGKAYVIAIDNVNSVTHWEYTPPTGNWHQIKKPTDPLTNLRCAFSAGGVGYFIGSNLTKSHVFKYDPLNDTWTKLSELPFSPSDASFVLTTSNKGYLLQGLTGTSGFKEYNIASDTWSDRGNSPVLFQGGFTFENKLYALSDSEVLYMYAPE